MSLEMSYRSCCNNSSSFKENKTKGCSTVLCHDNLNGNIVQPFQAHVSVEIKIKLMNSKHPTQAKLAKQKSSEMSHS